MKREQQHTPTPWYAVVGWKETRISPENGRFRLATLESDGHAHDAQYIITAVNSHEMLIETLREMCNQFYPHKCKMHGPMICDKCEALRAASAALIVAGGKQELNNGSQNICV